MLLHHNSPSRNNNEIRQFLARKGIVTLDYAPYSPDLSPCNYFLCAKLKIRFKDISEIEVGVSAALDKVPKEELEESFEMLLLVRKVVLLRREVISSK